LNIRTNERQFVSDRIAWAHSRDIRQSLIAEFCKGEKRRKERGRGGERERERERGGKDDRIARIFIERQFKNPFSATGKLNLYYRHVTVEPILYENRAQYGANAPLK
jgi:hypothetical protein